MYVIQRVHVNNLSKYNTNNYPVGSIINEKTAGIVAEDYRKELDLTSLKHYADCKAYRQVRLSSKTINILKKYNNMCSISGRLSRAEELWSCIPELSDSGLFSSGTRWFFRFSTNSPKDGAPDFPVLSEYDVLEKIVTSRRAASALRNGDDTLYFELFSDDMGSDRELRVFIYKKKITAISTYSDDYTEISQMSDAELKSLTRRIIDFWASLKATTERLPESYTMDIFCAQDEIRLIEFNSFGYHLAAGSCLFDWIDDFEILYSSGDQVVFRIAEKEVE